jgi:hypothetical protein
MFDLAKARSVSRCGGDGPARQDRRPSVGETEIDEALVRALLHQQHPDLAGLSLRKVAGGWDNQQWRLGGELAVRMPRTQRAPGNQPAGQNSSESWSPTDPQASAG